MTARRLLLLTALLVPAALGSATPAAAAGENCTFTPDQALPNTPTVVSAYQCALLTAPTIVTPPQHGTVTVDFEWRGVVAFTYTAEADYRGPDTFTWSAGTGTHTVNVQVVAPPLQCQVLSEPYDAPPPFTAKQGQDVSAHVSCSNLMSEQGLRLEVTQPERGTVQLGGPAQLGLVYRPPGGYSGPDRFTVRVVSRIPGRSTAALEVPVTVQPANRPPVCASPPPTVVVPDRAVTWASPCTDPDGDPISYGIRRVPPVGWTDINANGTLGYAFSNTTFRGPLTLEFVAGDGFSVTDVPIVVELRDAQDPAPPPPPPAPPAPPPPPPPPALPAPPEDFVPARGADVGGDAAVWGPLGGIRLGRRALPVVAVGCRVACTIQAQLQLLPKRRPPIALPAQTLRLAAGRRDVVRMRLTGAARTALRTTKRVKAVLSIAMQPAVGAPVRDTVRLRVSLPAAKPAADVD